MASADAQRFAKLMAFFTPRDFASYWLKLPAASYQNGLAAQLGIGLARRRRKGVDVTWTMWDGTLFWRS